mmetsp:Transcript_33237/g.40789  ORF Transcript_33237/g.40789 Transcript_33237/m.40789 type:complete len:270 (+) Transcript_33237:270-1079(+)
MIETTCVWPMEYVKTQLQLHRQTQGANGHYKNMITCARYTYNTNGFLGFYRGLAPVLVGSIPKAGIRFGGFNYISGKLRHADGTSTPLTNLIAGTIAGAVEATLAVTPIETVKTKLIDGNKSFVQGFIGIYKAEGIRGLYQGWGATVGKQASNQGLRFMAFTLYKDLVLGDNKQGTLSPIQALIGGMCSGCFSTLCNNPFDMMKTRMQGLQAKEYNNIFDCFRKVVRNEGVTALWKGTAARLTRVVPGQGIIFMSYEQISTAVSSILEK